MCNVFRVYDERMVFNVLLTHRSGSSVYIKNAKINTVFAKGILFVNREPTLSFITSVSHRYCPLLCPIYHCVCKPHQLPNSKYSPVIAAMCFMKSVILQFIFISYKLLGVAFIRSTTLV